MARRIKDGKGAISTKSGALKDYPYGFASRFEGTGLQPGRVDRRRARRLFHHGAVADPG